MVAEFVEQKRRPASAGRFSSACIKIMVGKLGDFILALIASPSDAFVCRFGLSRFSGWLRHNSNSYGDAVTDDSPANNDAAISKLEDTVRELETCHETLIEKKK
jgi:hypothetical protein